MYYYKSHNTQAGYNNTTTIILNWDKDIQIFENVQMLKKQHMSCLNFKGVAINTPTTDPYITVIICPCCQ